MGEAMLRTSYSQMLNSSRDFSTAVCYGYLYRSDDGGDSWRKLWREFSEVSSVLWIPQ